MVRQMLLYDNHRNIGSHSYWACSTAMPARWCTLAYRQRTHSAALVSIRKQDDEQSQCVRSGLVQSPVHRQITEIESAPTLRSRSARICAAKRCPTSPSLRDYFFEPPRQIEMLGCQERCCLTNPSLCHHLLHLMSLPKL